MSTVAIVTAREAEAVDTDLPLLRAALERLGIAHRTFAWDDATAPFAEMDLAVIRSTWDYVPRRDEFVAWAKAMPCPLRNGAEIIAWNTDKRYLRELERAGIAIVPTQWFGPGDDITLPGADAFVVKPSVSAGARDTARYVRGQEALASEHVRRLVSEGRTTMVQPYVASVDRRGETGMLFFGGELSHAIAKGAILRGEKREVAGLFAEERIQKREPSSRERAFAEAVLAAIPFPTPLYARVDVVEADDGSPLLLELELAEPSVFLDMDEGAADRFARAIAREL